MTVRSLARELGISATAVSLALKNSPRISPGLRSKVQAIAAAQGYVPNAQLAAVMSEVRQSAVPAYRATIGLISLFPEERPWIERPLYRHLGFVREGARARAAAHGYKLDDFWVKRPGLTPARLRGILEARGIRGLLCLGSLDPEEHFPAALRRFVVVTHAASIPDPLHRVVSHFVADARTLFEELLQRGYQRPGLVILVSGDRRTDHLYSAAFLSHQERRFARPHVPILRAETWDAADFDAWYGAHRPDVIVLHQYEEYVAAMDQHLLARGVHVPRDVGIALLDKIGDRARYCGIRQDPQSFGAVAIDMLLGRLLLPNFDPNAPPKVELVQGHWNEGASLRPRPGGRSRPLRRAARD